MALEKKPGSSPTPHETPTRSAGIVLVLISAIIVMLLLVAIGFLAVAKAQSAFVSRIRSGTRVAMAATSGMEYAASRLSREEAYPRLPETLSTRGEDWRFRDAPATPAEGGQNPSYSHGEAWLEAGSPDGRFAAGDVPGPDIDQDGSFTPRSGRVRGGSAGLSFLLKVDSAGGRLPLNAGFLDAPDRNANGVPDCRDLGFVHHRGLAHALNNLGEMLLPPGHPRRISVATENPFEPILYSRLGDDLVLHRPAGGYRTPFQLEGVLRSLGGGAWYPAAGGGLPLGFAEILSYLDLGVPPAQLVPQSGPPAVGSAGSAIPYHALHAASHSASSPVEMATSPREVLESLWRHVACDLDTQGLLLFTVVDNDPRTAGILPFFDEALLILHADEARRLSEETLRYRTERLEAKLSLDWIGFYRRLMDRAESIDTTLFDAGSPSDGKLFMSGVDPDPAGGSPGAHCRLALAKADLAFMAVSEDPQPFPWMGPVAWAAWGIDRPDWDGSSFVRIPLPPHGYLCNLARLPVEPPVSWTNYYGGGGTLSIEPLGLTLRPPVRFCIDSVGFGEGSSRASLQGSLTVFGATFLSSQEDFENLEGAVELARIGLQAKSDPVAGRGSWRDNFGTPMDLTDDRVYPSVVSLPRFPRASYPPGIPPSPTAGYFPRRLGALAPASFEAGPCGADLYWAFGETDVDTPAGFSSESAIGIAPLPWGWPTGSLDPSIGDPAVYFTPPLQTYDQFTAWHVTGKDFWLREGMRGDLPDGCPGLPLGTPVPYLAFEGWVSVESAYGPLSDGAVFRLGDPGIQLSARMWSSWPPTVRFDFLVRMPGCSMSPPFPYIEIEIEAGSSRTHHVALILERIDPPPTTPPAAPKAPFTRATMIVDGGGPLGLAVVRHDFNAVLRGTGDERLSVVAFDELRIRTRPFNPVGIHSKGRFVRVGNYISPVYTFDRAADLGQAEWTGIVPSGWRTAAGAPAEPISAWLTAYDGPEGTGGATVRSLAGRGELADLSDLVGKRSFRYAVQFDATGVEEPSVLADAPVFESIWLTFRRRGSDPSWSSWRSR